MPLRFADDLKRKFSDDSIADAANRFDIAKRFRRTAFRVNQPLSSDIHMIA